MAFFIQFFYFYSSMKIRSFIIICMIAFSFGGYSQNEAKTDSLYRVLKTANHDSARIKTYLAIIKTVYEFQADTSLQLYSKAIQLVKKNQKRNNSHYYKKLEGDLIFQRGVIAAHQGDQNKAISYYQAAFRIFKSITHLKGMAESSNAVGENYSDRGMYDSASVYLKHSYEFALKSKDKKVLAEVINNTGVLFYHQGKITETIQYFRKSLAIRKQLNDPGALATGYSNLGIIYETTGKNDSAEYFYKQSLQIRLRQTDHPGLALAYNNLATLYYKTGNVKLALNYMNRSLKEHRISNNKSGMANSMSNLAVIYNNQGNQQKALELYRGSKVLMEEIENMKGLTGVLNNMGFIFEKRKEYDSAFYFFNKALEISKKIENPRRIAESSLNVGIIYQDKKQYKEALPYYTAALKQFRALNDYEGLSRALRTLSEYHIATGNYALAIKYGKEGLTFARQNESPESIRHSASALYHAYSKTGQYKNALENYELYIAMRDSMNNSSTKKAAMRSELDYEYDKKILADSLKKIEEIKLQKLKEEKKEIQQREERKRQQLFLWGALALLVLVAVIAIILYRSNKQKNKDNLLITLQKEEVQVQKEEIEWQKTLVEEKNKEIIDSINYAQRIQHAILAQEAEIQKYFPQSFLYYKPKDIVAGDFYFFEFTPTHVFYAAADCTGHGVPGALVSVVCANALTRCVKEFGLSDAGKILDKAREIVLETFKKSGEEVKDGMDISLLVKDLNHNSYSWAGANNPLWIGKNGNIEEITADKQPIGLTLQPRPFTTHQLHLSSGDYIYLFTDGFADQFGGPKGKKYKYKNLQQLLLSNKNETPAAVYERLHTEFTTWKGEQEQVDDVCVIGIRI